MTDSTAAAHARAAYRTFEPFHISAYFNPELGAAGRDTGLDGHAWYVGSRAEPMGPCAAGVVAAAFYSFNTTLIERSWPAAIAAGLDTVARRRWDALDTVLGGALGESVSDPASRRWPTACTASATRSPSPAAHCPQRGISRRRPTSRTCSCGTPSRFCGNGAATATSRLSSTQTSIRRRPVSSTRPSIPSPVLVGCWGVASPS